MKNKRKHSIFFKTQIYLILFCILVLLFLWAFEKLFFDIHYKKYKEKTVDNVISLINDKSMTDENALDYIESLAYKNDICIIVNNNGYVNEFNTKNPNCNIHSPEVRDSIRDYLLGKETDDSYKVSTEEGYLSVLQKDNYDILVYSSLRQNNILKDMLEGQMVYIIIICIILSSAVSIYISNLITKPIRSITKKAKNIGKENYNNKFTETGLIEIDELNETLDGVQKELGKVGEYQKDLLANVTHDLKTPLTMIRAYAEKIRDLSYKDKNKLDNDVNVIIDESERLTTLVNDVLDMSRASSDLPLKMEEYDLALNIKEIMHRFDIVKEKEGYNIKLSLPDKALVYADKNRIEQVIYNLIGNALNYTGNDKTIYVKLTPVNKHFLLEITDTGKGIKEDEIDKIWTKYYKNDKNHKRNVVSSGVGLSIVKSILEKHNFKYGVKSKVNEGTTFYFEIPTSKKHKKITK